MSEEQQAEEQQEAIRLAMRIMGSRKSEAKTTAARTNAQKPRNRPVKPLSELECNCGGEGLNHKATCPRGRAIRRRRKNNLPLD